ncbi:putative cyanovirin-N [Septoria linicola]|nr:putative cyanovirin-N [Septoria linicola]
MSAWGVGEGDDGRTFEGRHRFGNFSGTSICIHLVYREEGINLRCCSQTAFNSWVYNEIPLSRILGNVNGKFSYGAINFHHRARHIYLADYYNRFENQNSHDWLEPDFIPTQAMYAFLLHRIKDKAIGFTALISNTSKSTDDLPSAIAENHPELANDVKLINDYRKELRRPPPPSIMTEDKVRQLEQKANQGQWMGGGFGIGPHQTTKEEQDSLENARKALEVYTTYVRDVQAKPDYQASNGWPIASSAQPNAFNQDKTHDTGGVLRCELYQSDGTWVKAEVNLDEFIDNNNGRLQLKSFPAIIGISNEIGGIPSGKTQEEAEQDMMIAVGEKIDAHPDWKVYHTKADEEGVTMYYIGAGVAREGEGILIKGWNASASASFQHFMQEKAPSRMQEVSYDAFQAEVHADAVIGEYIGAGASLNLFKGHAGPFELTLGIGMETGIGMKDHSIELEVDGCGFTIGQHCSISVAGTSIGIDFGRCTIM